MVIIFIIDQILKKKRKNEANALCCVCVTDPFVHEAIKGLEPEAERNGLLSNNQLAVD